MTDETQGDSLQAYPCVKKAYLMNYELTCFNFTPFDIMLNFIPLSNQSKYIFLHSYFLDLIKHVLL